MDKRCVNYGSSWCAYFKCSECPVKDFRHEPVEPTCPECKGYGQIRSEDLTGEGQQTFYLECAVCNGTGEAPANLQPAEMSLSNLEKKMLEIEACEASHSIYELPCPHPEFHKRYGNCVRCKVSRIISELEAHDAGVASKAVKDAKEALECAEYAFLHPASNQEFALNAVQQALAHIRAMAGKD